MILVNLLLNDLYEMFMVSKFLCWQKVLDKIKDTPSGDRKFREK